MDVYSFQIFSSYIIKTRVYRAAYSWVFIIDFRFIVIIWKLIRLWSVVYFDQLQGAYAPWSWLKYFFSAVFKRFISFFLLFSSFYVENVRKRKKIYSFLPPLPVLGCYSQKLVAPKSWSYSLGFSVFSMFLFVCVTLLV
jgi:hypothetical protein